MLHGCSDIKVADVHGSPLARGLTAYGMSPPRKRGSTDAQQMALDASASCCNVRRTRGTPSAAHPRARGLRRAGGGLQFSNAGAGEID